MGYFSGTHNLVMLMSTLTFFMLFLQAVSMAAGAVEGEQYLLDNQLLYLNREMIQISGYGDEKLSTVLVTGSVVCEACLRGDGEPHLRQWPIPGARVVVHCHDQAKSGKSSKTASWTDEYGDFVVDLPSHLHAIPNLEKACSLKVVRLPNNSICRPTPNIHYLKKHNYSLILSSTVGNENRNENDIRTYNTGQIKFLHATSKSSLPCINKHILNQNA